MATPPYSPPPYVTPPAPRRGMPGWGWALLAGCGAMFFFTTVILAAILFPVFAKAREKARQTACLSNLKQIGLASMMYQYDYDGTTPPASRWMDSLTPYTKKRDEKGDIFSCPVVRTQKGSDAYGYAYNSSAAAKPVSKIANPESKLMFYDSSTLTRNASDAGTSLPAEGRHSDGNNMAFADGHARWSRFGTDGAGSDGAVQVAP